MSLIYPTLLITVVMIMVTFLFTYVVPKFADLFNSLDAKLPAITVFMLAVGQNAQKYGPFVCVGLVVFGFAAWRWKETDSGADRIDRMILSTAAARRYPGEASGGRFFADAFDAAAGRLAAGSGYGNGGCVDDQPAHCERRDAGGRFGCARGRDWRAASKSKKIFPELAVEMIEVGEATGALPAMLNSVAEFYEEDVQTALGASMALIEPIILMIMAVFVGGVLISLIFADLQHGRALRAAETVRKADSSLRSE